MFTVDVKQQYNSNHQSISQFRNSLTLLFRSSYKCSMGTNLNCMVVSPVGRCYCLPENLDKLWLHVTGHCAVVKSFDVATRERLQRGGGSHSRALLLSHCPPQQSAVFYPVRNATPDHNGASIKVILFVSTSVNKAYPVTSVYLMSTIRMKKE